MAAWPQQNSEISLHSKSPETAPEVCSEEARSFPRVNWGFSYGKLRVYLG